MVSNTESVINKFGRSTQLLSAIQGRHFVISSSNTSFVTQISSLEKFKNIKSPTQNIYPVHLHSSIYC